jgi:endonuclease YncB( thermonuclease family)
MDSSMNAYENSQCDDRTCHRWTNCIQPVLIIMLTAITLFGVTMQAPEAAENVRGNANVTDADTIRINDLSIRIFGIDAPEGNQWCTSAEGGTWPCGKVASMRLNELANAGQLTCTGNEYDRYKRLLARCAVADGRDLGGVLIDEGLAWAFVKYSEDYVAQEKLARGRRIGIWQADTQTAWDFRALRWADAMQDSPEGCPIKGNISRKGEQIYHTPWSPSYTKTRINTNTGERWFCDEAEALKAGWRAPIQGTGKN